MNEIFAIMILILIILSIVNGVYIAYSEGRAAGQRQWARDLGLPRRVGLYRDEYDGDEDSVRARVRMEDEQYDADTEESMLSF